MGNVTGKYGEYEESVMEDEEEGNVNSKGNEILVVNPSFVSNNIITDEPLVVDPSFVSNIITTDANVSVLSETINSDTVENKNGATHTLKRKRTSSLVEVPVINEEKEPNEVHDTKRPRHNDVISEIVAIIDPTDYSTLSKQELSFHPRKSLRTPVKTTSSYDPIPPSPKISKRKRADSVSSKHSPNKSHKKSPASSPKTSPTHNSSEVKKATIKSRSNSPSKSTKAESPNQKKSTQSKTKSDSPSHKKISPSKSPHKKSTSPVKQEKKEHQSEISLVTDNIKKPTKTPRKLGSPNKISRKKDSPKKLSPKKESPKKDSPIKEVSPNGKISKSTKKLSKNAKTPKRVDLESTPNRVTRSRVIKF